MKGFGWACGAVLAALFVFAAGAQAQHRVGQGGRAPMARADSDGDGSVTREEAQAFRAEAFTRFDADGDGFLTDADREARRRAAMERRHERRAAMMRRLDTDNDGRVSRAEFLAGPMPHFDRIDANGNGVLEPDEVVAARAAHRARRLSREGEPPMQTP
jgi:hypothetical protein